MPLPETAATTISTRSGWAIWRADRLTRMVRAKSGRWRVHSPACRHASSSTQAPISRIRPESSASSMKAPASSRPLDGVVPPSQRLGPDHDAGVERELGLVVHLDLAHLQGATQVGLGAQPLGGLGAQVLVEDLVAVAAPGLGQVHGRVCVADQPLRVSSTAVVTAMPMLTVVNTSLVPIGTGRRSASWMRWARLIGLAEVLHALEQHDELVAAQAGHRVGGPQHGRAARGAVASRSWSPALWPSESLTTLNRSRSRNSSATEPAGRERRESTRSRWSSSSARLASPVSGSCRAWWASSASVRLSVVMSVVMTRT